jgi:hypothetical protein
MDSYQNLLRAFAHIVTGQSLRNLTAFPAFPVQNRLERVNLKFVFRKKVPLDFVQQFAVQMNELSTLLTLQVKMLMARTIRHILITGAFAVVKRIFPDTAKSYQLLKVPVYSSLSDNFGLIREVSRNLACRNVGVSQRGKIVEYLLTLPGVIVCGSRMFHTRTILDATKSVNMKMETIFS